MFHENFLAVRSSRLPVLAFLALLLTPSLARATTYYVGCIGGTAAPYSSISSVLPLLVPGDVVLVSGTCRENVVIQYMNHISLIGNPSAILAGNLYISDSSVIYIYGLNVTATNNDGIDVNESHDVALDTCTSNGNAGVGLSVFNSSDVFVVMGGSYDNNGDPGIYVTDGSTVQVYTPAAVVDISNNMYSGVFASGGSLVELWGNVTISGNKLVPGSPSVSGFGIDFRGEARSQIAAITGNNVIQGNQAGGASLMENAEASFWGGVLAGSASLLNVIQNNGPAGVVVSFGSQVTFYDGARIFSHTDVGVDVYGHSQVHFNGDNIVQGNATGTDPARAALRLDGTSEAFLRGGQFLQNGGPAILALVNSSLDFSSLVFVQNAGGNVVCDSSAYMVSDLGPAQSNPASGITCKTPHNLGNHRDYWIAPPRIPNFSKQIAQHDYYQKLMGNH